MPTTVQIHNLWIISQLHARENYKHLILQTSKVLQARIKAGIVFFTLIQSGLLIADSSSENCSSILN